MNSSDPIGGYFELELRPGDFLHADALLLNSGRSCFEYILRAAGATRVYLPKYTCDVMLEPLERLGVPHTFYRISEHLELESEVELGDTEFIVYTNYFGLKDDYCRKMARQYGARLILDCSQAYYFEPVAGIHTFYSPRKFFGVPDGGCLYSSLRLPEALPIGTSYRRTVHLTKRLDEGAEAAYDDFKAAEDSLSGEPVRQMSRLTRRLLGNVDFRAVRQARQSNFAYLHRRLKDQNGFPVVSEGVACPMAYPLITKDPSLRQRLIDRKIFVPTYWPNVLDWCDGVEVEYRLAKDIIPLPIDQRYGEEQMERVIKSIDERQN